jgi:hypothetical protein
MKLTTSAKERAHALLDRMRQTPMRRGALPERAWETRSDIATALAAEGVPGPLARRRLSTGVQVSPPRVGRRPVWRAVSHLLQAEIACLKQRGHGQRRIATALPKLSADHIVEFLDELTRARIGDAHDSPCGRQRVGSARGSPPVSGECRLVARQLQAIDPAMARTVARDVAANMR